MRTIRETNGSTTVVGLQSLPERLAALAAKNGDAVAITAPGRVPLNYSRLCFQIEQVAKTLASLGIERNHRVAVVLPNGPEMAVAFAGVASCATCAPLNPAYRFDEFDYYLADLGAAALIIESGTSAPARSAAQKHSIPIVELTSTMDEAAGIFFLNGTTDTAKATANFSRIEDAALILHTSGTTARPKMVALTHGQIMASAANIAAGLELTEKDRCLNVMPLFHIHGLVGALLSTLMAGGSVACSRGFDAEKFFHWLEGCHPTWYTAVPTIHQAIVSQMKARSGRIENHSLRFIRSCSAPLPAGVGRELEEIFHVPVIEAYGMTEAAHQIACNPLPPRVRKIGSVGLPTGTEIAVMDDAQSFLPNGQVGEIVVRGSSVITGYAKGEGIGQNSFSNGWFRTGDQGYLDADGYLYLSGRLKDIINRGGEKISPREIEEVLLSHPEISQAAVFRVPHPSLGEDVAAAVVLRQGSQLIESSIREALLDRIAEFKVPAKVLIVDELPKGATGKLNRTELSARFTRQSSAENGALKSEMEEKIAAIYREVLGGESIGRDDNFFDLGGDSVRATQVINRVRAVFEVNLSIATIFRKPTVAELAVEIVRANQGEDQKSIEKSVGV